MLAATDPTFEYCAANYLNQWVKKESQLSNDMQRPNPESVRNALAYFKVSRNFPGIGTERHVEEKIIKALAKHSGRVKAIDVIETVKGLTSEFYYHFGSRNLSAASKLLWLCHGHSFTIYDSRAAAALRGMRYELGDSDYQHFHRSWRDEFKMRKPEIREALDRLPSYVVFTAAAHRTEFYVRNLCKKRWFAERVFDQYLWQVGGKSGDADSNPHTL